MSEAASTKDLMRKLDGSEYKPKFGIHYAWWILVVIMVQMILDGALGELNTVIVPTWLMPKFVGGWGWTASMYMKPIGYGLLVHAAMSWVVGYAWDHWIRYGKMRLVYITMGTYVVEVSMFAVFAFWMGPDKVWLYWTLEIVMNLVGPWYGNLPVLMITNWFGTRRGLVLGMVGSAGMGGTPLVWGWLSGQLVRPYTSAISLILGGVPTSIASTGTFQVSRSIISMAGMRFAWKIAACCSVPIIPLYYFFIRTWPQDKGLRAYGAGPWSPDEVASKAESELPPEWNWGYTVGEAVRTRAFWFLFFGILMCPFFWMIEMSGYTIHGGVVLGLPVTTVGLGFSLYGWWLAVQGGLLGHVFDWRGWDNRFAIAWGPVLGITGASICLMFWRSATGYLLGGPLIACGIGAWFGMIAATYISHFGPKAMGMVYMVGCRFNTWVALYGAYLYSSWLYDTTRNAQIATMTAAPLRVLELKIPAMGINFTGIDWPIGLLGALKDSAIALAAPGGFWPGWHLPGFQGNIYWGLIFAVVICLAAKPSFDMYARLKNPPPWAKERRAELEMAGKLGEKPRQPWR